MFFKHPMSYVDAFLNNQIGNFYTNELNEYTSRRSYDISKKLILATDKNITTFKSKNFGFNITSNIYIFHDIGRIIDKIVFICINIPIVGWISMGAVYIWFMIISLVKCINQKKYKKTLLFCSFLILYLLTILLGPCDCTYEFRYILPFVIASPIIYLIQKNNS